jgi:membrane protein YdbS with pleckstrin-like domain
MIVIRKEAAMRRMLFWFGWAVLLLLPMIYGIQIYLVQDLPKIESWKWLAVIGAVLLVYASRNRDDVLKHHVV